MGMHFTKLTVTTTGTAGSATGSAETEEPIEGEVMRVDVDYNASCPGTDVLTLKSKTTGNAVREQTIITESGSATDFTRFPTIQHQEPDGSTRTSYGPFPVCGTLTAEMSSSDALSPAATIGILWRD